MALSTSLIVVVIIFSLQVLEQKRSTLCWRLLADREVMAFCQIQITK